MGLAGRKVKQRIPNDPRNLSWADDAARFGSNYLSKFGWDSSKGLGAGGEGRTSHVKVAQKLDMLGIGAAHQMDPNGIAWKQNNDFESLLKRLNEGGEEVVVDGFVKPKGEVEEEGDSEGVKDGAEGQKQDKKEKERKKKNNVVGDKKKDKKRKRENRDGEPDKALIKKRKSESKSESTEPQPPDPTPAVEKLPVRVVPRHRSHRARHIAAKSLASKSAVAISEILGIAPPTTNTPSGTQTEGKLTSIYDENNDNIEVDRITTSTKSLEDYFKEKMAKLKGDVAGSTKMMSETVEVDYDDVPRGGLGSRRTQIDGEDGASRIGPFRLSSSLAAKSLSSTFSTPEQEPEAEIGEREERRRRKKEQKTLKRQEKERKRQEKDRERAEV